MKSNREIPILFSAPMVNALLDRRKVATRRLAYRPDKVMTSTFYSTSWTKAKPGDVLWVREAFGYDGGGDPGTLLFGATWEADAKAAGCDNIPAQRPPMKPGIHMPRAICRLTRRLTAVHVEPLHAITDEGAVAEGIMQWDEPDRRWHYLHKDPGPYVELAWRNPRDAFQGLWERLHGKESWASNPYVVVLQFEEVKT